MTTALCILLDLHAVVSSDHNQHSTSCNKIWVCCQELLSLEFDFHYQCWKIQRPPGFCDPWSLCPKIQWPPQSLSLVIQWTLQDSVSPSQSQRACINNHCGIIAHISRCHKVANGELHDANLPVEWMDGSTMNCLVLHFPTMPLLETK